MKPIAAVAAGALLLALAGCAPAEPLAQAAVTRASVSSGSITGGTVVQLTGEHLGGVTGVTVAGEDASLGEVTDDAVTFTTPASHLFATGPVPLALVADDSSVAAGSFTYEVLTAVDRQMEYLFAHWEAPNAEEYGVLDGTDCVNFASQGLLARGWGMDGTADDADWWFWKGQKTGAKNYSKAWISSTAFRAYLSARPELATVVGDDAAAIGDIIQFDWDGDGDPNHTGTISGFDSRGIRVVQHSTDHAYLTVQRMLDDHPGATYWIWHLPAG